MARIRILFITNSLAFGGAEKHSVTLINDLDRSRFELGLAYLKQPEDLVSEVSKDVAIWGGNFQKQMDWLGLYRLSCFVKKWRPDILVCVNDYPLLFGTFASFSRSPRPPLIDIFHSTETGERSGWKSLLIRMLFNQCERVVYLSENQRRFWAHRSLTLSKGIIIHNGVDIEYFRDIYMDDEKTALRQFYGFRTEDFVVGICAALRPEKKHTDLLEAIASLRLRGVSVKCLIIGDGPCRTEIEAYITNLRLGNDVAITGFKKDVRPYISCCDVIALVSHAETFSIAALEAMALSRPLIMSNVGGATEQIVHGENGYLYECGNIAGLAETIDRIRNLDRRCQMGLLARQQVEQKFNLQTMIQAYERLFEEVAINTRKVLASKH
jgi:glycosyltransferase involved in cell wall biosynthesis